MAIERPLHDDENAVVTELVGNIAGRPEVCPSTFGASPGAKVLSDLAHEMGHIHWHATVKQGITCYRNALAASWLDPAPDPNKRWQPYNVGYPTAGHRPGVGGHIPTIRTQGAAALPELRQIYSESHFGSLLGSATLEEDFVETYRLAVLYNANNAPDGGNPNPLRELPVSSPSGNKNMVDALRDLRTSLGKKANCITTPIASGGLGLETLIPQLPIRVRAHSGEASHSFADASSPGASQAREARADQGSLRAARFAISGSRVTMMRSEIFKPARRAAARLRVWAKNARTYSTLPGGPALQAATAHPGRMG